MHLLITDSGVGGLSVCAYAERYLRNRGFGQEVKLTYVNASPENDFGYNSMGSREEKVANFDRFLQIVTDEYAPDSIFVACNTLSVLMHETAFVRTGSLPIQGIVEVGVRHLHGELLELPQSKVAIFGTVTTISEHTHVERLLKHGIDPKRVVSQACPSLADTISEDRFGDKARQKIERYVDEALEKPELPATPFISYLACTHYGYRKELFLRAFEERGMAMKILDPNELVADDLFASMRPLGTHPETSIEVEFVTRYRIPETALETIAFFLEEISPETVEAFEQYTHRPDLY